MGLILEEAKKPENQEFGVKRIPKEVLEGARFIGRIRRGFRGMLETYVPQVGYSASKNPRILDLGCGPCYEAHVLSSYFGGEPFGFDSDDVLVVGIDINEKEIEKARMEYSELDFSEEIIKWVEEPNYKFIHGDARELRKLVDGEFDVVVARHPNVAEMPDNWYTIFREAREVLKPDGLLIATSPSDTEHEMMEEQIQRLGYKIVLSCTNMYAIPTSHEKASIDRKILIARV
jgi:SAM-dependent methyltransferase